MTTTEATVLHDAGGCTELSERLADVFRTGRVSDVLADDLFLDGHPPFWRFQIEGVEGFGSWLADYAPAGIETSVVRTIPTATGFVTEFVGRHIDDGQVMTDRKLLLCEVRDGRIAAMTVFCSGDWDEELRTRHRAEASLLRP